MDNQQQHNSYVIVLLLIIGTLTVADSYRADFIPSMPLAGAVVARQPPAHAIQQQNQGCKWSTESNNNSQKNGTSIFPPFLRDRSNSFALDCNVRTLNADFNYTFNRDQVESTTRLNVKCNDKLFFESVLDSTQSYFRLRNLNDVSLQSCKIRKIPTRIWASLGSLKRLTISSMNNEWSSAFGMEIMNGAFEGLENTLVTLDISQNNVFSLPANVLCPLRSLRTFNVSRNRLVETISFGSTFPVGNSEEGSCVMNIQNLDLSYNTIRRINSNEFIRMPKLTALKLDNNYIQELSDNSFYGLHQLNSIHLQNNKLVALPPTIFKFSPKLREINLRNNSISGLSPLFPESTLSIDISQNTLNSLFFTGNMFHGLTRLIVLKISHNRLSYIDATIFKDLVNLQALHLDNNRIETISPQSFTTLKNLVTLDLSNNFLSVLDDGLLSNLFSLKNLYLDENRLRHVKFENLTSLQDLSLKKNVLTQIPEGLPPGILSLDLGENQIYTINNDSFEGMSKLMGLRLVENRITELPTGFCKYISKLTVLNLAENRLTNIPPTSFSDCPELRVLRIDSNRLEQIPELLISNQLLWLNISSNKIRRADTLLPSSLEWLDLSHNELPSLPLMKPETGTTRHGPLSALRIMDASFNKITFLDHSHIPPLLETLRVNHNKINTVNQGTFSRATRLRRVELFGNEIEHLSQNSLRFPPVSGKERPPVEVLLGSNPLRCDCSMEWLTRVNTAVGGIQPRIVDLDAIVCQPTFAPSNELVPLVEVKDFLCPYTSHCFALCQCCSFDACDCAQKCPENCNCFHNAAWSSNIVQCSNANFSEIPSQIPMDATELYLDGNHFPDLNSHIFLGKKNLRRLFLNNSHILTIRNKTFNGLRSLEILHLENNLISQITGIEFADLVNLKQLFLNFNSIVSIAEYSFTPLTFLQILRLDDNMLDGNFNAPILSQNKYLNSVMLAGGNPYSCTCEFIIPFRIWMEETRVVLDSSAVTCQPDILTTVGSNSTHQFQPQLITTICDHFNPSNIPAFLESDLLESNHISAEKIASTDQNIIMGTISNSNNNKVHHRNHYPPISTAEETNENDGSELWTIFTSVLIIVFIILVIAFLVFRKDPHSLRPFWLSSFFSFSCCYCGGNDDLESDEGTTCNNPRRAGFIASLFNCCCGENGQLGKKSRANRGGIDDSDKLFDAYFLYSRKDEDLLVQKIAPELESVSSGYSTTGTPTLPPPPPHHGGNSCYYRLCLHYRDLCLSAENPLNTDMVLSACDASKRIVLVISRSFLQNELSHPGFRSAIQTAISRYPNKFIFIILPPFTEQNMVTIYSELKAGHFTTMTLSKGADSTSSSSNNSQITSLEWNDKNFWSKLKLILPTPTLLNSASSPSGLNSTSTISSTGSSAIFNMAPAYHPSHHNLMNYNNSINLQEYAYNTINSQNHQYHRNILPFQQLHNTNTPPVPKHHIALSTAWQQQQQNQNFYNNSQHSQIIPIPGYPATTAVINGNPLMVQNFHQTHIPVPAFNESFRRHLTLQQSHNKMSGPPVNHQHHPSNCSSSSQTHLAHPHHTHHHHHHQGSHCSSNHSSSTSNNNQSIQIHPYQPLDTTYSSSNEELLDHVYSTLDTPPISNSNNGCSEIISKQTSIDEQNHTNNENSRALPSPSQLQQNRLNNNTNCPVANNTSGTQQTPENNGTNPTNNNGTMYFV